MPTQQFDASEFINCRAQNEAFEDILSFGSERRVLAVSAPGQWGKSSLMRMLKTRCLTDEKLTAEGRIPVSLIHLQEQRRSIYSLIEEIARDLSALGFKSERFELLRRHYRNEEFEPFARSAGTSSVRPEGTSAVNVNSNFENASQVYIAGTITNVHLPENYAQPVSIPPRKSLTDEQKLEAERQCIQVFFEDLWSYCTEKPAVFLFDTFEQCEAELSSWLMSFLLERLFKKDSERPRLVLIFAGRVLPKFTDRFPRSTVDSGVIEQEGIGPWEEQDVKHCLRVFGPDEFTEDDIFALMRLVKRNVSPTLIIDTAKQFSGGD